MTEAEHTPSVEPTIAGIRRSVQDARARGDRVALVPTMGALHDGHLSLVRRARELAEVVVVSVFVNPLQFGPAEDFDRYPRTLDDDVVALRGLADVVFAPSVEEMYPTGPTQTRVAGGEVAALFEGASRPGHFDGMLTVVDKLLNIVQPDAVLFGQKDAQQVFLVRQMVTDLNVPVFIEAAPIVREDDGLALSSRNRFLDENARGEAVTLSEALHDLAAAARRGTSAALEAGRARVQASSAVKLDYLAIVDPQTFRSVTDGYRGTALALIAAQVGTTRLIDNASVVIG
ncbi:pantoate--beta-alanine ligase [Humibacter ginsenosidimutans]|uniref:Pantothenate synthetase n=1 Tax=Humibacter ginsenosidimutans TaxID=2599293 RepID=A0A5B8M6J2_9MICO|nr:pantoate--beta-alanine ligase [Humibacter ginsenosidimutans]QDZ15130.1 pantoate--beta-alanine ligase [Humibacter ginsenosidimutans]